MRCDGKSVVSMAEAVHSRYTTAERYSRQGEQERPYPLPPAKQLPRTKPKVQLTSVRHERDLS